MFSRYLIFLVILGFSFIANAAVQTQLDKTDIDSDEMVMLTISSNDHLSLSPDLDPLKNDFYITGTSQNSSFNFINGTASIQTQWQISLMPKHSGEIQIPSLIVGKEKTAPQVIHVAATKSSPNFLSATKSNEIFMETNVIPKEAFIQEQFVYNVKLYFTRTIENAYLMAPEMSDAKITQNGQDIIYTVTKKGHYYRVLERSYLITPEKTGQFTIQAPVLKGYLETANDRFDVYGLGSHAVKPIKIVGQALNVNVKPKPANFVGQWLPARKVTIQENWDPSPPIFREGEPVTRIITVDAIGATGDQIPNIVVPQTTQVNIYNQPAKRDTNTNNGQQEGVLTQNIVYIPTATGKITLPAITVKWWNSVTKKEQLAILPAKAIKVLPALVQATNLPIKPAIISNSSEGSTDATIPTSHWSWSQIIWPIIATVAIALWLLTMWLWRKQSRTGHVSRPHSLKSLSAQLKDACAQDNPRRTRELFLKWAVIHWKDQTLHNLADVVAKLEQQQAPQLLQEIMQLEANFYANHKEKWHGNSFWQALQDYIQQQHQQQKNDQDPLPPLYCSEQ